MIKQPNWGMGTKKIKPTLHVNDWPTGDMSCHGKQISAHKRELAPATNLLLELAPSYQTSLI